MCHRFGRIKCSPIIIERGMCLVIDNLWFSRMCLSYVLTLLLSRSRVENRSLPRGKFYLEIYL